MISKIECIKTLNVGNVNVVNNPSDVAVVITFKDKNFYETFLDDECLRCFRTIFPHATIYNSDKNEIYKIAVIVGKLDAGEVISLIYKTEAGAKKFFDILGLYNK